MYSSDVYPCSRVSCDKEYKNKGDLTRHESSHDSTDFQCPDCDYCQGIVIPRSHLYAWAPIRPLPLGVTLSTKPDLGKPAIRVLATAPLRRLALSVLFTIVITSYQTTCTVSKRSSIKGTHQCKPTWSTLSHYDNYHHKDRRNSSYQTQQNI